jgi:spermidine synthase
MTRTNASPAVARFPSSFAFFLATWRLGESISLLWFVAAALASTLIALCPASASAATRARAMGTIEADVKSEYSHILVRRQGDVRTMVFVRDSGEEAEQSRVNIKRPYELLLPYSRAMFASYLFKPEQKRVLVIGLGGGGMVQFLKHYDTELRIEAVEIDPAVVKIADQYFGTRSEGNVKIVTADAFEYLAKTDARYDVIYMDAFLKPAADTDPAGVPLRLKTLRFYKDLERRLTPDGLVAFNLNRTEATEADLRTIRAAFAQVYVFRTLDANLVVIASLSPAREPLAALKARAREADGRFHTIFSFQDFVKAPPR